MNSKCAQSAIEFIILVGVVLFVFLGFLFLFSGNLNQKAGEQRNRGVEEVGLSIQKEIQLALKASDGYVRTFTLPEKIYGRSYSATIVGNNTVYVKTDNDQYAAGFQTPFVIGNLTRPSNVIKKINGTIYLNQQ